MKSDSSVLARAEFEKLDKRASGMNWETYEDYLLYLWFQRNGFPMDIEGVQIPQIIKHHSGGFVDSPVLKSNEEFAKLMKGEFVSTPAMMKKFMGETLPSIASSAGTGNTFNSPLVNIQCDNVTQDALPGLEDAVNAAVEKVQKIFTDGISRTGYRPAVKRLNLAKQP